MATKCFVFTAKPTVKKIRILLSFLFVLSAGAASFAQSSNPVTKPATSNMQSVNPGAPSSQGAQDITHQFKQRISWQEDKNAYEYKVEIQSVETQMEPLIITTTESSVSFNLPGGKYRYKIYAYDFLGRSASETPWQDLEIIKAVKPQVKLAQSQYKLPKKKAKETVLSINAQGVTKDSKVILKNTKTEQEIAGKLEVKGNGKTLTADSAVFEGSIEQGEWVLQIVNPSGLSDISMPFEVAAAVEEAPKEEKPEPEKPLEVAEAVEAQGAIPKDNGIDLQFMLGAALYDITKAGVLLGESQNEKIKETVVVPYATISYLPFKSKSRFWKLGMSVTVETQRFMEKTKSDRDNLKQELTVDLIMANLVLHNRIIKDRLYLALSAGMGLGMVTKESEIDMSFDSSHVSELKHVSSNYEFITLNGGLSLFWIPVKHIAIEGGANFIHSSPDENKELKMINPFVGMGLRF